MSTAICYSGQARSFAKCVDNHRFMLTRHFPDAHIFVSVVDDDEAGDMELLRQFVPGDRLVIEREDQPFIDEPENLEQLLKAAPNPIAAHTTLQAVLRQFWQLGRVGRMLAGRKWDTVIRVRPDLYFHRVPPAWPKPNPFDCYSPWWAKSGGVNDRFAVMGQHAGRAYFGALAWAQQSGWHNGCPVHPETMLAEALRAGQVNSHPTLMTTFSFLRKTGEFVLPDPSLEDIADLQALQL